MTIGLANSYESFLLFRLAIGVIGASFVITQYHTSAMFAPNVVGTANATTAGWGNLGGGATQMAMPLVLSLVVAFGADHFLGWRVAMVAPGIALLLMGIAHYRLTQDAPAAPGDAGSDAPRLPAVLARQTRSSRRPGTTGYGPCSWYTGRASASS